MRVWRASVLLVVVLAVHGHLARAGVNGVVLQHQLDAGGNGYTVMRVWGTPYEMGYAQGYLLSEEVTRLVKELKGFAGEAAWSKARQKMDTTVFRPAQLEDLMRGLLDGMKAKTPDLALDLLDVKVLNTGSDWIYALGCRSHSCWGKYVSPPVKTLTTRRLDWGDINLTFNHLVCAYDPTGEANEWVGMGLAGTFVAGTLVTEAGTVVAMHDFETETNQPGAGPQVMTRAVATLYAALMAPPAGRKAPLDAVYQELRKYTPFVGGFLCYYAPGGKGGVITFSPAKGFYDKRTPKASYFGGNVLITTNDWTEGTAAPPGGEFLHEYYAAGGAKTLADHWAVMGDPKGEFHQVSVAYRKPGDMTIWSNGKAPGGQRTPRLELEWSQLFPAAAKGSK